MSRVSLQNIYRALMRSVFDYGCIAYMPVVESNLRKLDVLQDQALMIWTGSLKTFVSNAGRNWRENQNNL